MKDWMRSKLTWLTYLFWPILISMYGAIIWNYFYTQSSIVLTADLWRYIPIAESYYQSGFTFSALLLKHGEHLQLVYNAWFLINSLLFDLNTRLELFIGLAFLAGIIPLLYRAFNLSMYEDVSLSQRRLAFLLLASIVFSFHQLPSFTYNLLAFVSFGEMLLMLVFLLVFDQILINDKKNTLNSWIILAGIYYFLGAGFAGGGWVCYIAAAMPVLVAWQVTRKIELKSVTWACIGLLAISFPVYLTFALVPGRTISGSSGAAISYVLSHAADSAKYLITLLANSVVDINTMENLGFGKLIMPIGISMLIAQAVAIYLFFRVRIWEKTYIPLFLIMFFWAVALALLMFRLPIFGISNAAAPRYATVLQIGLIGTVWIFILAFYSGIGMRRFKWLGMSALIFSVASLYFFHLYVAVLAAPYYQQAAQNNIQIVKNEQFEKFSVACPHENVCKEGIKVLKEHKLNVFKY